MRTAPTNGPSYAGYHETRFQKLSKRAVVWKTLWTHYFSKYIALDAAVLDLGAGYGDFINHARCAQRFAVDVWPDFIYHLDPNVVGRVGDAANLDFIQDGSLDCVLASNLFEHLDRDRLVSTLSEVRRKLKPAGMLFVLQPNFRYAYRQYFDDYTHISIFTDRSMRDFLIANGFRVLECWPRFLPLTVQSRFPVSRFLVWLYLKSPFKPFGGQMLLRASPAASHAPTVASCR